MQFDNQFDVPLPPEAAWKVLLDVERIAPCLPGAELTEVIDERTFKGRVNLKLGPVALAFNGTASLEDVDDEAHTARVKAAGNDAKGRGAANAKVDFRLEPVDLGSRVFVRTDLKLTGMVAQYGRGAGMIKSVADQLIGQFVKSLEQEIARDESTSAKTGTSGSAEDAKAHSEAPRQQETKPISGFSLLLRSLWAMIRRVFSSNTA